MLLSAGLLALVCVPSAPAAGKAGRRTVVTVHLPPSDDVDLLSGLRADLDGRWEDARAAYGRARRMGRCPDGSRCAWHDRLDRDLVGERAGLALAPGEFGAHANYAITCANKLIALRLDTGLDPEQLFATAEKHYHLALDLAPVSARSEVLLGLAALHGEAGEEDRARALFSEVRPEEFESATAFGNLAYFLTTIGELDQAFAALDRALSLDDAGSRYRDWVVESDDFHRVRNDPRLEEILARH